MRTSFLTPFPSKNESENLFACDTMDVLGKVLLPNLGENDSHADFL